MHGDCAVCHHATPRTFMAKWWSAPLQQDAQSHRRCWNDELGGDFRCITRPPPQCTALGLVRGPGTSVLSQPRQTTSTHSGRGTRIRHCLECITQHGYRSTERLAQSGRTISMRVCVLHQRQPLCFYNFTHSRPLLRPAAHTITLFTNTYLYNQDGSQPKSHQQPVLQAHTGLPGHS